MYFTYRSFSLTAGKVEHGHAGPVNRLLMRIMLMIICLLPCWPDLSEAAASREASPLTIRQIHGGHSLTDSAAFQGTWPGHLEAMINEIQTGAAQIGKSTVPGSPMSWRWNETPEYGIDARGEIADWEVLVITEAVPLTAYLESPQWLRTWTEHAWENGNGGNGATTLLYTTWSYIDGDFRSTLDDYEPQWEAMADFAAANLPEAATVYIVPGHRLMMGLYDDIEAGIVPGVSDISAFFADTIHPNGLGSYAIALLHLAVLHHVDPRGLPHSGYGLTPEPSPALAAYLQEKVWDIAISYERTGLFAQGAVTVEEARAIARIYTAAFDRYPKNDGLNFWIKKYESGVPVTQIAAQFSNSPEFRNKYGELSDRGFIEQLFKNVLGREGAQQGIEFWLDVLANGQSRGYVLARFSDSMENIENTREVFRGIHPGSDGAWVFPQNP